MYLTIISATSDIGSEPASIRVARIGFRLQDAKEWRILCCSPAGEGEKLQISEEAGMQPDHAPALAYTTC